jgi:general stress protein 26
MLRASVIVAWTALCLISNSAFGLSAENQGTPKPETEAVLAAAREIVQKVRLCGLVTVDDAGQPQVRTMDPFPPDKNWNVVLATNRTTRKVEQIRNHPQVALYYFDPDSPGYVTLVGKARLVDDQQTRESHWKDEWKDFYEDEYRGNDYLLIEVTPLRVEVMSIAHRIAVDPKGWKPAIVEFGD